MVNRERELEFLEEAYREARAQLIIIYGRRSFNPIASF